MTVTVSPLLAPYLGADRPREERLKAAAGLVRLPPTDLLLLLYSLCRDSDLEVKATAMATLRGLDLPILSRLLLEEELHPRLLDLLVQLHFDKPELALLFAAHPMLSSQAYAFLLLHGVVPPLKEGETSFADPVPDTRDGDPPQGRQGDALPGVDDYAEPLAADGGEDGPVDEESAQFQSKYLMAMNMGVAAKIKAALTGNKEWRSILIKDSNKLVSVSVVRNPRISDGEVLAIAKSAVQNEEIMRVICANKEWVKNPLIRKALAENNKTPIPAALRFVATLSEKDLSVLARSKSVSSVIASQARRILMTKRDGR